MLFYLKESKDGTLVMWVRDEKFHRKATKAEMKIFMDLIPLKEYSEDKENK